MKSASSSCAAQWRVALFFRVVSASQPASADAGWFEAGDAQMRLDLQLLNDAEIIRYPLNQWPIPRAAIAYALANSKPHYATNAAVAAALSRVRTQLEAVSRHGLSYETSGRAGRPGLWREFDTLSREDGELEGSADYSNEWLAADLDLTAVTSP
jgi:hypothetical protein